MAKKKKLETPVIPAVEVYEQKMADANSADVANKVAIGLDSLTPDDIAKSEFNNITNIPNSAAIDYTQSIADKMSKDYSDEKIAEIKKEDDIKAPVVDENVAIIDTTKEYEPPTEEEKKFEEEKTSAQWQKELYDKIFTDSEADKKKKKAAQWVLAAQMLGDSIAALGNSYFTSKGANAMTLNPGTAKAAEATSQLSKDIRDAQEKAYKAHVDEVQKKYEREYREARDKKKDEKDAFDVAWREKVYNDSQAQRAKDNERLERQLKLQEQRESRLSRQYENNTPKKDSNYSDFTLSDGETIRIDNLDKNKLRSLYRSLPEDVRNAIELEDVFSGTGDYRTKVGSKKRKVTDDDRLDAIYDNLDNPEVANAIRKMAGVSVKQEEVKSEVVVDPATGNSYSVNPDMPFIGATQTSKHKKKVDW